MYGVMSKITTKSKVTEDLQKGSKDKDILEHLFTDDDSSEGHNEFLGRDAAKGRYWKPNKANTEKGVGFGQKADNGEKPDAHQSHKMTERKVNIRPGDSSATSEHSNEI